jgi:hypothetical protein
VAVTVSVLVGVIDIVTEGAMVAVDVAEVVAVDVDVVVADTVFGVWIHEQTVLWCHR